MGGIFFGTAETVPLIQDFRMTKHFSRENGMRRSFAALRMTALFHPMSQRRDMGHPGLVLIRA